MSRRMVFFAACLGMFMVSVEATIVATAIPTIVGALGGLRLFSWVFGIYFLTQAVTIPIYGRLADVYGRKPLIIVAVALFIIGSALSGFAHNMVELIVYRGLQGLGAGGVQPVVFTIVGDLFTGTARLRVQGILSSVWGVSAIVGPLLGAFLIAHTGWPTIFWINVPFGVLLIAVILQYLHEHVERQAHRIDYAGSVLLATGIGTLMFVLVMLGTLSGGLAILLTAVALLLIGLFIAHELRTPEPMMPLRLYRVRVVWIASAGNLLLGALSMGVTAFLPTYVQGSMGLSAVLAGSALGITSACWTVSAVIASRICKPGRYRPAAIVGGVLIVIGSAFLVSLQPGRSIWVALIGAAFLGLGFGLVNLVLLISIQSAFEWGMRGAMTASAMFSRQVGSSIGTAVLGAVFNLGLYARIPNASDVVTQMMDPKRRMQLPAIDISQYAAAIAAALHGIYLVLCFAALGTLVLTFALPRREDFA